MSEVQDKHTGYIYVGCISHEAIHTYIENLIQKTITELDHDFNTGFVVNMPTNAQGEKQSYCYIWWDSAEIFEFILEHYRSGYCNFQDSTYSLTISRCDAKVWANSSLNYSSLTTVRPLPNWVTQDQLVKIFSRYNVSGYFACNFFQRNGEKHATIRYDRDSNDAIFALIMNKVVLLEDGDKSALLFFNYARAGNPKNRH